MKLLIVLALAGAALAQAPPSQIDLATRLVQLMEATAVAAPGLVESGDPLRRKAEATLTELKAAPRDAAIAYRFVGEVKAYVALSDATPRPAPLPETAELQLSELHDLAYRLDRGFAADLARQNEQQRLRDADPNNLKRYATENSALLPAAKPRAVFLGDSITDFWRLNEYFTGRDFVNRGISGQTTIQILGRFLQDVAALRPKAVLILAGTNDLARGIALNGIEDNLTMLGDLAKAHGVRPLFASVLPVSDYHKDSDPRYEMSKTHPAAAIRELNRWLREYCAKEGFGFVDYYSATVDKSGQLTADLSDDGLHPNAKGYRVMSPLALEAVDKALSDQPQPPAPGKRRFGVMNR